MLPFKHLFVSTSLLATFLLPITACGPDAGEPSTELTDELQDEPQDEPLSAPPEELDLCASSFESATPRTIQGVVDRLNELPKPTSIPCFLRSLPRPLRLSATDSIFSAQPAVGARSPRFFIFSGALIISVVPSGNGAPLLEMGEVVNETDSVKAEIKFPVEEQLTPAAPYEGLRFNETLTTCGICHAGERVAEGYPTGAFVSEAIRPRDVELVDLEDLEREATACASAPGTAPEADAEADPEAELVRCAMLQALFAGEVTERNFPETFDDFF